MQDEHVVGIIDDALTGTIKVPNQMNVGPGGARAVEPGLPKGDGFVGFCLFVLEKKDLMRFSKGERVVKVWDNIIIVYLFRPQQPLVSLVLALSNSYDQIALYGSKLLAILLLLSMLYMRL